jgi:hypothetical protein
MKNDYKTFYDDYGIIKCPHCNSVLDEYTLYGLDCICPECGTFVDIDELGGNYMESYESARNYLMDDYWGDSDYGEEYYNRLFNKADEKYKDEEMNTVNSFVIRFITNIDYDTIKKSFEQLEGDIDYMELLNKGPIKQFLDTSSGEKLLRGLNLQKEKLSEYVLHTTFILEDDEETKKTLISTICQAFPLCVMREENSSYIMANNKGLAKGLLDITNDDEIELLSWFLTGYEKVILAKYFLWNCEPYRTKSASNIMIKWIDNSLITLTGLREQKQIPVSWQTFLAEREDIEVSTDDKDNGTIESFEGMLEDAIERLRSFDKIEEEEIVNVISLRGIAAYSLISEEGEKNENDAKNE